MIGGVAVVTLCGVLFLGGRGDFTFGGNNSNDTSSKESVTKPEVTQEELDSYAKDGFFLELIDKEIVLTKYTGSEESVEIPDIVTSIGDAAFSGCSSLASATVTSGSVAETYMKNNHSNVTLNYA